MPLWILADAHGGANAEADAGLLQLLDAARSRDVELLLLGDLFAVWLAGERFLTKLQREVVDRLRRLRAVRFVIGNRDFLVRESGLFAEVLDGETLLDIGGVPTLVAHGDRLNPDDRLYALWYAISRHPGAEKLANTLPAPVARRIANRLEAALARTNKTYKSGNLPRAALEAFGRRAKMQGALRGLVGHFHADTTIEVEGGAPVIVAPAWLDQRKIIVVEESGALRSVDPLAAQGEV